MSRVKVTGLDHIVLRCADVERSLEFYCDVLGLEGERVEEWRRADAPFPSVRLTPTTVIDLFGGGPNGTNLDHFCLVIEPVDLDGLAKEFPEAQRADHLFGAQGYASSLYVHDPDGNTVELRSYDSD
jgi:catechol 2,3-dioxygenase-like lactoylglutathione lyase family enzyme